MRAGVGLTGVRAGLMGGRGRAARVPGAFGRISQGLTQRVKELVERYEMPLPKMSSRVAELEANVDRHLERMGFAWK